MKMSFTAAAGVVSDSSLLLGACVSQRVYDVQTAALLQAQAQIE
jgi:hypothetical protein